jgi:hypothetical protein
VVGDAARIFIYDLDKESASLSLALWKHFEVYYHSHDGVSARPRDGDTARQFPALSQLESESTVPNTPAGSVYGENEQALPWRLPLKNVASPEREGEVSATPQARDIKERGRSGIKS